MLTFAKLKFTLMIINNLVLAAICNDLKHATKYSIEEGKCYYKGEFIGEIKEVLDEEEGVLNIYFLPVKPIEYITVNFTINSTGAEFKE
jgi:hypothetical protein